MFKNKTILITGGTGSFGKSFLKKILNQKYQFKKIIIFSRDELKQHEMKISNEFNEKKYRQLRYFIGDVRDKERLQDALYDVDYVVHAAALKQVSTGEYNPFEVIKTNIVGAQNLISGCLKSKVKKVIALSTDKAVSPVNLYGASKLCSDKLFISSNNIKGKKDLSFSVVRYGNVNGSRGSVIPFFKKINLSKKKLPLTHLEMTRFNISLKESVKLVETAIQRGSHGEIFVPKLKSFYIRDLIHAISNKKNNYRIIGIRPGEKIHEELINPAESRNTVEFKNHYCILPNLTNEQLKKYCKKNNCKIVVKNFSYNSGTNRLFMNITDLKKTLNKPN